MIAAAAIFVSITIAQIQAPTANAYPVGGVDIQGWCKSQFSATYAVGTTVNPKDALTWKCTYLGVPARNVNMDAACRRQYGSTAWAMLYDRWNAYSWKCWTPSR
ncbi:hypothetical protein GCM10007298_34040 [Williamsia phyllosphaerae]|uniref:Secreted protein n=1 Tax=Williamsia phyllosphaerae TaxID=885042 RepID=A0ABQ1V355_9NOCA|nr:hypothetical protein GCM10007298_34040 [Williamsia phyllosphaerae]